MKKILNESQLISLITETTKSVISESVINDYLRVRGLTPRNTEDGQKYVVLRVPVGKGPVPVYDSIRRSTGDGKYEILNPTRSNKEPYKDPYLKRTVENFYSVVREIEAKAREIAGQMEEEMGGYVKVSSGIYKGGDEASNTIIPVWEDVDQWGSYVKLVFSTTAKKWKQSKINGIRQAKYNYNDINFRAQKAIAGMKSYFNENAETEEDFDMVCKTSLDGNRWIVQFYFDEPDVIREMIAIAEDETGAKAMTSAAGAGNIFMFKF